MNASRKKTGVELLGLDHLYEGFKPWTWTKVAEYPKDPDDGDGHPAEVWTMRSPAKFTKVVVKASLDSCGEGHRGWAFSTGSGDEMERLCHQIAEAAAEGMIGFEDEGDASEGTGR